MKRAVYYTCGAALHFSGVGRLRRLPERPGSLRVLMYHKVNDQPGNSLSVPVGMFERHMAFLAERYRVISADDLFAHFDGGRPLPARAVLLTFDDGYRDVWRNAYPLLRRYGHRAVLFVSSDFIGGDRTFPHDVRFSSFDNTPLSWDALREMTDVFEVGSHACSHRSLTALDRAEARSEIVRSKAVIEERIGRAVRMFSYPKGGPLDFDADLRQAVIDAGYGACFTTIPKGNTAPLARFDLARYNAEPYGTSYLEWLLEGSCDPIGIGASRVGAAFKRALVGAMGASTD